VSALPSARGGKARHEEHPPALNVVSSVGKVWSVGGRGCDP
jgi:hypothetical protein